MAKQKTRRPRDEVQKFVELLENEMPVDSEWTIGGSYRRKAPTIGDLDIMVITHNGLFNDFRFPRSFTPLRQGPQIVNGVLHIDGDPVDVLGCDIWSCKPEQVGAFLMFITGPAALNIAQRAQAQKLGFTLSQYGLLDRNGNLIPGRTEQEVYSRLGLDFIEPCDREQYTEKPPPANVEWEVWQMPSDSGRGSYRVRRKGTYWECECMAFTYSRDMPRSCKHIKRKKIELGVTQ